MKAQHLKILSHGADNTLPEAPLTHVYNDGRRCVAGGADDLIRRSLMQDEIVHAPYSTELSDELSAESEDSAETPETVEYWGTNEDGAGWRVHLDRRS